MYALKNILTGLGACILSLVAVLPASAQKEDLLPGVPPLPASFYAIKDHTERLVFLRKLLDDSDGQEQYKPVRDWAFAGIAYASAYGIDTIKGQFYKDLGEVYTLYYYKPDSAIYYYKKSIAFYPEKLNKRHIYLDRRIAWNFSAMGLRDSTLVYLNELETILAQMPDSPTLKALIAEDLAAIYEDYGLSEKSIAYFQYASEVSLRNRDTSQLGLALVNLGNVYDETGREDEAIRFTRESLRYMQGSKNNQASAYSNLGAFFASLSQYDSALFYLDKSDAVAAVIGDSSIYHTNAITLAFVRIRQKTRLDDAGNLLRKALLFFKNHGDQIGAMKTLLYLSDLDTTRKDYSGALEHLEKTLSLARPGNNRLYAAMAMERMAGVAAGRGDYRTAFARHKDFMAIKDSISQQKARDELTQYEMSYKTQQREQQIQSLIKNNRIKDLQVQNGRRLVIIYSSALLAVLLISVILIYQRSLRNRIKTQKLRAELETRVLRAQMNPHFIFNSLSSIENFMMKNDKKKASDYFAKFASLIRRILDSSMNERVPLDRDMETLRLYVELEQLRFDHKFSFQAIIDPALTDGDYNVPPLLIQPYVENAILHGLAQSDRQGLLLQVAATLESDYIIYTVQDNGIGRQKSDSYRQHTPRTHKSLGMEITRQRVEIFNRQTYSREDIHITDLYDADEEPAGTRIQVKLKAI